MLHLIFLKFKLRNFVRYKLHQFVINHDQRPINTYYYKTHTKLNSLIDFNQKNI